MVLTAPIMALLAVAGAQEVKPPTSTDVEKKAVEYRRSIQRGHLVLKQKGYTGSSNTPDVEATTTIRFDGARNRRDLLLRWPSHPSPEREIRCLGCEQDGYTLLYHEAKPTKDSQVAITLKKSRPADRTDLIDPRLLGMAPVGAGELGGYHLEYYVNRVDRNRPTVEREKWKGMEGWRVSYTTSIGQPIRLWIVPDWGYAVVRIELERNDKIVQGLKDTVETDYEKKTAGGVWFPRKLVYERHMLGKLKSKQVTDVEVVSLNEPLPASAFKLAGMDLPKPWPVLFGGKPFIWDGQQLVPQDKFQEPRPFTVSRPEHKMLARNDLPTPRRGGGHDPGSRVRAVRQRESPQCDVPGDY